MIRGLALPLLVLAALGGCASAPTAPAGMKVGQFVTYTCEGDKRFQARAAEGGDTVRLRYEGGYELDRKSPGVYEADGWKLITGASGTAELHHNGKQTHKNCKLA
jgi:hypothetical protein